MSDSQRPGVKREDSTFWILPGSEPKCEALKGAWWSNSHPLESGRSLWGVWSGSPWPWPWPYARGRHGMG